MKLTCSRCNDRPRASIKSHRCLPCEREYRLGRVTERRDANAKWWAKVKKRRAQDREDRIQWFMRLSADELANVRETYIQRGKQLPRLFNIAMNRLAKRRRSVEFAHLAPLPDSLGRAIERHRKANQRGSRPGDFLTARHAMSCADEAKANSMWTGETV